MKAVCGFIVTKLLNIVFIFGNEKVFMLHLGII